MKILYVADGRSPTARNWMEHFLATGHTVHLASTFDCAPDPRLASYTFIPVAYSQAKRHPAGGGADVNQRTAGLSGAEVLRRGVFSAKFVGLRTRLRQALGLLTLPAAGRRLGALVEQIQPDLVHAMRIPFEGMLAAQAGFEAPLLISVWGNDFTLHARANPWMGALTRRALNACAGLLADCRRDIRLAGEWGLPARCPTIVLPGAGGLQPDIFYPPAQLVEEAVIIQPRGFRAYVDNAAFFHALPVVVRARPDTHILCPGMAGEAQVQAWVSELGLSQAVELLPPVPRAEMARLFRSARVMVSPTHHDGTPNSLLEAMACGCLPVAGDLESIREWIDSGENGLLVDLKSPGRLAEALLQALSDDALLAQAAQINARLVAERAAYPQVMAQAEAFYQGVAG